MVTRRDLIEYLGAAPLMAAAELPVASLRDQLHRELFRELIPFFDRHIIDHELGGFCCNADRDGTRLSGDKVTWYQGRGLWVYAFLYRHFGREQRYLDVAAKTLRWLERTRPRDPRTLRPIRYDREGRAITPPDPEVYGDLFVAEGLAEYSAATGERGYWDEAKRLALLAMEVYDRPDYAPRVGVTYLGPNAPPIPGARVQGVWMIVMRLATQMLRQREDADLERLARRSTGAIMGPHYNPEWRLNRELLLHDFSVPPNEYARQAYVGHAMETFWMVMDEALRRKDAALFDQAADRFRNHVEVARDRVYGGVLENLIDVDRAVWGMEKSLWCHLEVLLGALMLVEHRRDSWAAALFNDIYANVQEKWSLRGRGLPLYIFNTDRKVTFERHAVRIENYHLPRFLMLALLSLDRIKA